MRHIFKKTLNYELPVHFDRISWDDAFDLYGSDKPDLRFGMEIRDVTDLAAECSFSVFRRVADEGGKVWAAQSVAFADPGPVAKTFGDTNFTNTATNSTSGGGGAITYSVDNPAVAEVDASTGEVTIKGAGTATITATAAAAPGYAETKANYTLNVSPMTITPAIVLTPAAFEYDGTDKEPAVAVNDGALVLTAADYTVAYENNRNAGTAKVIVKPAAGGNYTWTPDAEQTFAITPKALDQSAFTWSTAVSFPYDGNAHSVTLTNLPAGVSVVYTDNTKTYVGSYTASAVLNVDANHTLTGTLARGASPRQPTPR